MHNQTLTQSLAELLEISEKSVYRWKTKDHIKLMSLLDKYFTKEDIEEWIEYGTIEKLEFANSQDYGSRVAEFVKLLNKLQNFLYHDYINVTHTNYLENKNDTSDIEALDRSLDLHMHIVENADKIAKVENEGLLYLAIVFANYPLKNSTNSEDFTVDNLSKLILYNYDEFKKLQNKQQGVDNWINSILLGNFLDTFRKEYPQYPDYSQILFRMAKNDFLSLVKLCLKYQPNYLHIATRFCIQFNLYKYMDLVDSDALYYQIINKVSGTKDNSFDYEKFKKEIKNISYAKLDVKNG